MDRKSSDQAATLLQDGRVAVIGGGGTSVELFNPTTKTWSTLGVLPANHTGLEPPSP